MREQIGLLTGRVAKRLRKLDKVRLWLACDSLRQRQKDAASIAGEEVDDVAPFARTCDPGRKHRDPRNLGLVSESGAALNAKVLADDRTDGVRQLLRSLSASRPTTLPAIAPAGRIAPFQVLRAWQRVSCREARTGDHVKTELFELRLRAVFTARELRLGHRSTLGVLIANSSTNDRLRVVVAPVPTHEIASRLCRSRTL